MIKFKSLNFKNFLSFGNNETSFDLDTEKSRLIVGNNEDIGDQGSSRNGVGKCLGVDTPVLMFDGTVKMVQDVVVGDQLMGDDGTPRNVLSLARGREELFKVKQNNGMDYVVNRSHILSLKVGTTRPKWGHVRGEIINIPVDTYLSYPKGVKKAVCGYVADLKHLDNGEDVFEPWLIGLWLVDGTSDNPAITYNVEDVSLYVRGGVSASIRDIGIFDNTHIPRQYLHASYENRLELLAGILDGDGYNNRNWTIDIVLKDNQLPHDVAFLARSVGLRVKLSDKFAKCQNFEGANYKRLTISGDITKIPNRLTRKCGTGIPETAKPRHYGVTGITLESIGEGDYYGFEIDGNRLFCLGDFTVTHNTTIFNALLFGLFGKGIDKLKTDEFINIKNGKNLEVEVVFEKGTDIFTVRRKRKPNSVEFLINGESLTLDAMKNTDELIVKTIGMSYENFMATFFMAPHKHSFMAMSGPEQRSLIEEMLSLHVLQERAESLKLIRKDLEIEAKIISRDVENAETNNKKTNELIDSLGNKSTTHLINRDRKIGQLGQQLEELKSIDIDKIREAFGELAGLKEKLAELSLPDVEKDVLHKLQSSTLAIDRDIHEFERKKLSINKLQEEIEQFEASKVSQIAKAEEKLHSFKSIDFYEEVIRQFDIRDGLKIKISEHERTVRDCVQRRERIGAHIEEKEKEVADLKANKCPLCGSTDGDTEKVKNTLVSKLGELDKELCDLDEIQSKAESMVSEMKASVVVIDELYMGEDPRSEIKQIEKILDEIERHELSNPDYMISQLSELGDLASVEDSLLEMNGRLRLTKIDRDQQGRLVEELTNTISEVSSEVSGITEDLHELGFNHVSDVDEHTRKISELIDALDEVQREENPFTGEIEKAKGNLYDVSELLESEKVKQAEVKHVTYLIKLLTDNKSFIRKNIVDKYVPYLNKKLVEYTQQLGLPHICEINSDMSVDIQYMSSGVSYYNLSQGERLRLNIATTFAFRDLMLMLGKNTNIMLIDEMLDSALDDSGRSAVMRFITDKVPNLLIISHREEVGSMVDQTVTITKRNGFSFVS